MSENLSTVGIDGATTEELRTRLIEAEETLWAIRHGEVDALLIKDGADDRVYTLRSADAPYRALVEQMQEGAITVSREGTIVYSNRRFAEMVDRPLQQVIGAPFEEFIDPADRETLRCLLSECLGSLRTRLGSHSGAAEAHLSLSEVIDEDVRYCTIIVSDVSTLMRVQRESQSKDEFLAMLAHELRNPLGAIEGAVHVLGLSTIHDPTALHARAVIHRQARHMAQLVDDLLDVARVMTGKIVLNRTRVDFGDSVRGSIAGVTSGHASPARIETSIVPAVVDADPVRLEQIVGNLLANAIKFAPHDKPVRVSVSRDGLDAVLVVADEGIGISPELLPHIFDLFVQAHATPDRAKGGLGIGLTLVRQLVELHGGTITASSPGIDAGSRFEVRLPLAPETPDHDAAPADTLTRRRRRVLLVDDHADARDMYTIVLEADGHEVFQAGDGPSAVEMFASVHPDVAVIDIGLPEIDGYEVARRIRASAAGADAFLIALTGYGFPEDRERSRAAGFNRHLVKPATADDLRRVLDGSKSPRQT